MTSPVVAPRKRPTLAQARRALKSVFGLQEFRPGRTQLYFLGGRYPRASEVDTVYAALQQLAAAEQTVSLADITSHLGQGVAPTRVRVVLSLLKAVGVAAGARGGRISLRQPGLSSAELSAIASAYQERQSTDRDRLEQMMRYGQTAECRWAQLLDYFGESLDERCGTCDNCRFPLEAQVAQPA
jgi:ATP-dependent DNA helicase RecQ